MPENKGKIKEFFEQEADKLAEKIERTPIEKFFIFFLIMVTAAALVMGYLQFRKNIDQPLFSSYLSQKRAIEQQNYLNSTQNTNSVIFSPAALNSSVNLNGNVNAESNSNTNAAGTTLSTDDLAKIEQMLLSGDVSLKDLGIDDPALQQQLDEIRTSGLAGAQLSQADQEVLDNLKNLTPAQIRDELVKQGIDKNTLDQISDEDLKNLFLQTLSQYQSQ
ncbi:MAG: hypothetical protein PHC97_02920 [Patescibacteria group bacterium]|nr:hypothetical protein [Patescibacteria group bacterium]